MSKRLIRGAQFGRRGNHRHTSSGTDIYKNQLSQRERDQEWLEQRERHLNETEAEYEERRSKYIPPKNLALADALQNIRGKVPRTEPYVHPDLRIDQTTSTNELTFTNTGSFEIHSSDKIDNLDEGTTMIENSTVPNLVRGVINFPAVEGQDINLIISNYVDNDDGPVGVLEEFKDLVDDYGFLLLAVGRQNEQGRYPVAARAFGSWAAYLRQPEFYKDFEPAIETPLALMLLPYNVKVSTGNQSHIQYVFQALIETKPEMGLVNTVTRGGLARVTHDYIGRLQQRPAEALSPYRLCRQCSIDPKAVEGVLDTFYEPLITFLDNLEGKFAPTSHGLGSVAVKEAAVKPVLSANSDFWRGADEAAPATEAIPVTQPETPVTEAQQSSLIEETPDSEDDPVLGNPTRGLDFEPEQESNRHETDPAYDPARRSSSTRPFPSPETLPELAETPSNRLVHHRREVFGEGRGIDEGFPRRGGFNRGSRTRRQQFQPAPTGGMPMDFRHVVNMLEERFIRLYPKNPHIAAIEVMKACFKVFNDSPVRFKEGTSKAAAIVTWLQRFFGTDIHIVFQGTKALVELPNFIASPESDPSLVIEGMLDDTVVSELVIKDALIRPLVVIMTTQAVFNAYNNSALDNRESILEVEYIMDIVDSLESLCL